MSYISFQEDGKPSTSQPARFLENPVEHAESLLQAAREAGDKNKERTALVELGIAQVRSQQWERGIQTLEEVLSQLQGLPDLVQEAEVWGSLGLAFFGLGLVEQAEEAFQRQKRRAVASGSPYAEKLALENVGAIQVRMRKYAEASDAYERALALAREVGDLLHQGELLWSLAIVHADLEQEERARFYGEAAIGIFQKIGHPHLEDFKARLGQYAREANGAALQLPTMNAYYVDPNSPSNNVKNQKGPGLLRMALAAAKALAGYLGSGLKMVSPETREQRLEICGRCEHHTGLRCRLCGCFTRLKSWLPHETCPVGKWPS